MKTIDLGEFFSFEPSENNDYMRGVERVGKTKVILCASGYYRGIPTVVTRINIGSDYKGKQISKYAEEIRTFDLLDGSSIQVLECLHSAPSFEEKDGKYEFKDLVMKPFSRSFRFEKHIKIENLLKYCFNSKSI
jgi:hypothetical protein